MRKYLLPVLGFIFVTPAAIAAFQHQNLADMFQAVAEPPALMAGCTDVPEAVELVGVLHDRSLRIERYMEVPDAKKAEIADAEAALQRKLTELQGVKDQLRAHRLAKTDAIQTDIDKLVAVYDQMKPADAAKVLTNLPADFAAEILMRVQPDTGARIMASVDPRQAALLTAEMGARSARKN